MEKKIKAAVITGSHPYDVVNFQNMLKSFPDIEFYPQNMEDFLTDTGQGREQYDVIMFYNMQKNYPEGESEDWLKNIEKTLIQLGENGQGLFILHHAVLAFPKWEEWNNLTGIMKRNFEYFDGQELQIDVKDKEHPIVNGIKSWKMTDETYKMDEPDDKSKVLLKTDYEKSMQTIGWTRKYKNAKVFCFVSGHDQEAYQDPNFQKVVYQGLTWLAE